VGQLNVTVTSGEQAVVLPASHTRYVYVPDPRRLIASM
jgi:hypothetical protein